MGWGRVTLVGTRQTGKMWRRKRLGKVRSANLWGEFGIIPENSVSGYSCVPVRKVT